MLPRLTRRRSSTPSVSSRPMRRRCRAATSTSSWSIANTGCRMPRRSCPGSASRSRSLVADNAPLDEWLAFNMLDFIYACDLGDDEAKGRFAAAVNTRAPLARSGAAHYRRFFCAFTSPAHAATAARVIDAARSPDPSEPQSLVRELVTGILGWRQELRERSTREVEAIHRHVGELDAALLRVKEAVAIKDAHIVEAGQRNRRAASTPSKRKMCTSASSIETLVELKDAIGAKDAQIKELDQQASALSAEHAQLEESTRRATALERELQVILTSRSWRLTAPLRRFRKALRHRTFITSPVGAVAGMRRWVKERTTIRKALRHLNRHDGSRRLPELAYSDGCMSASPDAATTRWLSRAACSTRSGIESAIPMWATPASIRSCTISSGARVRDAIRIPCSTPCSTSSRTATSTPPD